MAPKVTDPIDAHRKHVEEFLKIDQYTHEPKGRPTKTDVPNEDPKYQPKEKEKP